MNLYPNDLGKQVSWQVRQERVDLLSAPEPGIQPNAFRVSTIVWLLLTLLSLMLHSIGGAVLFGFVMLISGGCYVLRAAKSKNLDESQEKPVSDYEIQMARAKVGDALIQSYLDLALSVVKLPIMEDEAANQEVRNAVVALAVAVEASPNWEQQQAVEDDPSALRAEAQMQVEGAQDEADAVIAASRRRRAESLLRRADTASRTLLLLRRNRALREEVGEQIKALQTSLTALQVGGRQSAPELSGLAASIHRVALEANAVTVARAEVDTLLSQPTRNVEEAQAVRISI